MVLITEDNYLAHYGILRKSGRYPWGSGNSQAARNASFLDHVESLRKDGLTETQIARGFGITTTELRATKSIARNAQKQAAINMAERLHEKGYSNIEVGKRMAVDGKALNESSVRSLLNPGSKDRTDVLLATAGMLKDQVIEKGYLDIGSGVENHLGISQTKLNTAIAVLKEEGYKVRYLKVQQLGTANQTTVKVLAPPDSPFPKPEQVRQITDFSQDGGRSFLGLQEPLYIKKDRVTVRYKEDGGSDADGVMFVRPGVKDLSLGSAQYAQVRVGVNGTHYLKGMAIYKDDLPDGVDLVFNTVKSDTGNVLDAMKSLKDDKDNPFGAVVRQIVDPVTNKVTSAMNILNEEGDWEKWSRNLSSQMLSKQSPKLAKTQLDMTFERKKNELDSTLKLTNPIVRQKLLESYADDADSSAVHLKAASLPRQASHVILPIDAMKTTEVYAPNYRNGETVALIRYPHGGTFEIPELKVNNNNRTAKKALGNARDAIGIHPDVAKRLSGADFDGDTVLVIPNNRGEIKSSAPLAGLKNFDPQHSYPAYEGMSVMSPTTKQHEMGNITNLIADMTIRGASTIELAAAVRHSMVVIDAEKHNLDYKQSARDNGITHLKSKYQSDPSNPKSRGASTLITRANSEIRIPKQKPRPAAEGGPVDRATGRKMFVPTGESYVDKAGRTVVKVTRSVKLAETHDARTLSSGTPIEKVYAEHSNKLKALANTARKEAANTQAKPYSPSAKASYSPQVVTLGAKLNVALKNRPLERQAQLLANTVVQSKRDANPDMDHTSLKKIQGQALTEARLRTGAKKEQINITDDEWKAIQASAISNHMLKQILDNSDLDRVKELASPRTTVVMTTSKIARAQSMLASGYTQAQVAAQLGVSLSTLKSSIAGSL